MPQATDAYTQELFWVITGLFMWMPILGWICSLIAMKFYPLDERRMAEVQEKISEMKKDTEKIDA